jgi:hypothetical protein
MQGFDDLLAHWEHTELRDDLGIRYEAAKSMKRRGSVSPAHWARLISAAARKGIKLDDATLRQFWSASRKRLSRQREAA